ncbi:30S ribosomal protein S1 [Tepidibacillus fermentans]|uniref:Small subunit ribosomal protein S1 n=1 Tax=Tepidibacillus fermentans TaxID=1281767 RepID=A0A4R3KK10_9BACI|nr:30S ribosomal protein S1 [Tepidibacillus fermentans]TCS84125.1 small subunit ribosomal protein S1 [Tepidibacillus fermentans]
MVGEMNNEISNITTLQKGDLVKGKVLKIEDKQAIIDIGYKYDGILPIGEVTNVYVENIQDVIQIGDELELKVLRVNDEEEKLILSKKAIDQEKAWDILEKRKENNEVFEVKVAEIVKGGLIADVGVRGFIPSSLIENHYIDDFSDYKGKTLRVKIVELDRQKNRVILSQKDVLQEEKEKEKNTLFSQLQVGEVKDGIVRRITDFGVFVDIGGIDGLVHISEISWDRVEKPSDVLKEGQQVKVKIVRLDPETKRISLSIKETEPNPWKKAISTLKVDEIYLGTVKRLTNFGAFVEVMPNVEGLVHISQISHRHIGTPGEVLEVGQQVKVKILDIDRENQRISLSIKEAEEKETKAEEIPPEYEKKDTGFSVTLGDVIGDKLKDLK